MGWLRNRRRNKLKEALIQEGKLNQFQHKFTHQIKTLDERLRVLKTKAKEAHDQKDDYETRLRIHQHQETQAIKENVQKLLATLEKAALTKENQDVYDEFITQLDAFSKAFKDDRPKKRKTKRSIRKYKRQAHNVSGDLSWIDKRVDRIDKSLDRKENLTDKSLERIDIEAFFAQS